MIELRSPGGRVRAIVLPEHGGRLHQLEVDGEQLLSAPDDPSAYAERPTRGGSFPMAPWPNRIRGGRFQWEGREHRVPTDGKPHANHGRVLQRPWEVVHGDSTSCELRCALDEGWPWAGVVTQKLTLADDRLELVLAVEAEERFPVGLGWHPWFRREVFGARDVRLAVPARERYVLQENIPTGEVVPVEGHFDLRDGPRLGDRRLDDCFRGIDGDAVIDWGPLRLRISMACPDPGFVPHCQVNTPPEAFCVEPQTCAPDAFNLAARGAVEVGVLVAGPGEPVVFESTWRWERSDSS